MNNETTTHQELFEGAPYCDRCRVKLRRLGVSTVTCNHTSLTVGIDSLNSPAYNSWMAMEADLAEIISNQA